MRYLLTFLLILGIGFGQKTMTITEHDEAERKVEVKKEIKDGKVTLSITENGETEVLTADAEDEEAMAKLDKKLEAYKVGEGKKVYKKVIKHECDKEKHTKAECEHAKKAKVLKKVKESECEHAELEKEALIWHMKDKDGDIKIIKKHMDDKDFFFTDEKAGYLGVHIQDITEQLGDHFKIKDGGVLVSEVEKDSPAEKAGLKAGDIITKVDDKKVTTTSELSKAVRSYEPETKVSVSIVRDGKSKKLNAVLGEAENVFSYKFDDLKEMKEHQKMMLKMPHTDLKDFDFHTFEFDKQEFKADMENLKKELQELKEELKRLQEEK